MPTVTPLLSTAPGLEKSELKVIFGDEVLHNPHFLTIRLENQSGRDIRSSDFDQGKPLILDVNARIVAILATSDFLSTSNFLTWEDSPLYYDPLLRRNAIETRTDSYKKP
jgi:hypothetical protein